MSIVSNSKIKRYDWLFADTCPQATNHCTFFLSLRMNSSLMTSIPAGINIVKTSQVYGRKLERSFVFVLFDALSPISNLSVM